MRASIALLLALTAAPLAAQTAPATAPPVAAAKFSLDTPIETIVADAAGKAALDAALPGVTTHAMYEQFKSMSLSQVAPMSGGAITDEALAKAKAALEAVK